MANTQGAAHALSSSSGSSQQREPDDSIQNSYDFDEKHVQEDRRRATFRTVSDSEEEHEATYGGEKSLALKKQRTHTLGILKLRGRDDTDPTDWWFASTAIPLIAATFAPMANLLSIAALVVFWRSNVTTPDDPVNYYYKAEGYKDPTWCTALNAASLACGAVGNLFLLFNFTKRVRYIVALPLTIIFFYAASGILIGIIICMEKYDPPRENQVYSQGYWHAVIAASLYMLNSMILMVNMAGYFLGHYPQNFTLSDEHRNLILQTMLFFVWLGGGAGVFARTEQWTYPDALYFCDVTILTIGFGDLYVGDDLARGLVFPYSVGGTIILGLMVSSIHTFAGELSKDKVLKKHVETRRVNTLSRAVTIEELDDNKLTRLATGQKLSISRPLAKDSDKIQQEFNSLVHQERLKRRVINFDDESNTEPMAKRVLSGANDVDNQTSPAEKPINMLQKSFRSLTMPIMKPMSRTTTGLRQVMTRNQKQILMAQERDRFNAMRSIQINASNFKRYYALATSIVCFGLLWCVGAVAFFYAEADTQGLNYFQCLYFCYVSLLTIGYGDLSPKSNSGKAFFVVWSLIAVPTMTILISDLGDTVIGGFKRSVLENDLGLTSKSSGNKSSWRSSLARLFRDRKEDESSEGARQSRNPSQVEAGRRKSSAVRFDENGDPISRVPKTIEELATEELSETEMVKQLAFAIRQTADDLKLKPVKKYTYEEWVEFTRLIKFSKFDKAKLRSGEASAIKQLEYDEAVDGVVEWDWLDERSPMTSEQTESEWVLDRLCESLLRVFKKSDLVLGGLNSGTVVHQPGASDDEKTKQAHGVFENYSFGVTEQQESLSPAAPQDESGDSPQSPNVMGKMTKFFQGDEANDDTPQWSRRAKVKMAQSQVSVDTEERVSSDRRRSSTAGRPYRRHGPFANTT